MEARSALQDIARRSGGVFRARDAADAGVHWRDLYALRDEGVLVELSRGVFRFADAEMTPYLDLVAVSKRSPRGTICLNSALSFWDLTDEIPADVHLAVPRGSRPPSIDHPPTRVYVFAASTYDLVLQPHFALPRSAVSIFGGFQASFGHPGSSFRSSKARIGQFRR